MKEALEEMKQAATEAMKVAGCVAVGGNQRWTKGQMNIIAIDPGTEQSAIVYWDGQKIGMARIWPNLELLDWLHWQPDNDTLAIEMVASYGMPVGREVFETCVWIGRFFEAWMQKPTTQQQPLLIYRRDVKLHHCGNSRAKDSNIRQALIDKYGPPGTKKAPGVTYGLKKDLWSAFAIATYVHETKTQRPEK